ncbi:MAG: glycosyl hydrolase 115 family protein, partial [Draconibacterium sp.]|nr:glycosyl hydrolase 115 family protein [Draconibacterium sp.]
MNTKDFKTGFRMVVMLLLFLPSCADFHSITIITGENPGTTELITINQFKNDLESVTGEKIQIINDDNAIPTKGTIFLVGTAGSNPAIARLTEKKAIVLNHIFPGKRGGIRAKTHLPDGQDVIILAGSDVQGMQYAVYDYCSEILEIDPYAYWTGKIPPKKLPSELFSFNNKVIAPPVVPILCYFENDVDELANLREPLLEYDWQTYTEMIKSLVRLKYNAIHLFDMLGRPEFFLRPEYQQIRPGYDIRLTYIDSLINYAHDLGMMVQIDLSLGYKIKPMPQEKADCWEKNKEDWIATWKYYFEETPLRKADIFSLRPRNQVWDWEYASSCGEDKTQVFNKVYTELGKIIDHYKPGAVKVVTCYADGMEMFNGDFNPPKDWIIAWSDDGWGGFNNLPKSTKDYRFGTYMHAGFWK